MDGTDILPDTDEPRIPKVVMWAIYAIVIGATIMCLMAAVVFLLNPPG